MRWVIEKIRILPLRILFLAPSLLFSLAEAKDLELFQTRMGEVSPSAQIFLVAGSSQNANFAQEVMDQKRMWERQGFSENQIACYFIVPDRKEFKDDEEQWRTLTPGLKNCYPASVRLLREHLRAAGQAPKDFLYLFVTSHGQRPVSMRLKNRDPEDEGYRRLVELAKYPVMDQYLITVEGLPSGRAGEKDLLLALDRGMDPREVFLTPRYLREFLENYFPQTPKFLVLQGCYSGGFLKDPRRGHKKDNLKELDQMTVFTASRFDRASFGCEVEGHTTYFGGTFNEIFPDFIKNPLDIDWKGLFHVIKEKIVELEGEIPEIRPSEPLFFSNYRRS